MHTKHNTCTVVKPWGHELIWADTELYVGKILYIHAGECLSLQYHEQKDEVIHLLEGQLYVRTSEHRFDGTVPNEIYDLKWEIIRPGNSRRISPGIVHLFEAITDCTVLEVSTPHLEDVVRLSDRYGRTS